MSYKKAKNADKVLDCHFRKLGMCCEEKGTRINLLSKCREGMGD